MKRFLMILCMTVLFVVVLAVPAFATEGHTHCLCNDSEELGHTDHQCSSVPFVAVDQDGFEALFADGRLTGNASVYLTEDITLGSEYKLNGNTLNLCLHNKTITMTSTAKLYADGTTGTLNITACQYGSILAGQTGTFAFLYVNKGFINLYDGTIDASVVSSTSSSAYGGAVRVGDGNATNSHIATNVFTMYGGTIIGAAKVARGGAVFVQGGSFVMHGGRIQGGHATGYGGGVGVNYGRVYMDGGVITGCSGTSSATGGGVNMGWNAKEFVLSGNAKIYGNFIGESPDDVRIGNGGNVTGKKFYLALGQWNGNGVDVSGNQRLLYLSHSTKTVNTKVVGYEDGVTNPAAMRNFLALTSAMDSKLYATSSGMTLKSADSHIHCVCNGKSVGVGDHVCEDVIFTAATQDSFLADNDKENADANKVFEKWTDGNIRLKADTNIYLSSDVTLNAQYTTSGHVLNICLCDRTITLTGSNARLTSNRAKGGTVNGTLNLLACTTDGKILAGENCKSEFLYTYGGQINVYGGTVDAAGQAIRTFRLDNNGNNDSLTIYGGTIKAGNIKGGAIYNYAGAVEMYGGTIEPQGTAAVIYLEHKSARTASFAMHGGTLSGGTVSYAGNVIVRGSGYNVASYSKLQDAVTAAQGSSDVVLMNKALTEDITAKGDLLLDLNGFDVNGKLTITDGKLYLIDKATADYAVTLDDAGNVTGGYGKITEGVEGDYARTFNTPKATYGYNWKYLVLKDVDGALHAHRIYLAVKDVVLYPNTTSMKYKTVFYGDEVAAGVISDYGIVFRYGENMESAAFHTPQSYAGGNDNSKLTMLHQVLTNVQSDEWADRADKAAEARAYIVLTGEKTPVLESAAKTVSFKQAVLEVLSWTDNRLSPAQKMAMASMHEKYESLIHPWCGGDESQTLMHTDWLENTKCACLGQHKGAAGHETCQPTYFVDVADAEAFSSYFTWNEENKKYELNADASMRLNGRIDLAKEYSTNGHSLNIWLNNNTLKLSDSGRLTANKGGELSIAEVENGTGRIDIDREYGLYTYNGTINLYNGYVDASNVTSGSAINVAFNTKGIFNMYGGTISGQTLNICLCDKTLTMIGKGRLTANRAKNGTVNGVLNIAGHTDGRILAGENATEKFLYTWNGHINLYGGDVDVDGKSICPIYIDTNGNGDSFTMYGGTIKAGNASGGAVYVNGGTAILNGGTITAEGREITGNGGAVYVNVKNANIGTFTMNDGQILGGTANRGGAIYVYAGRFAMNDGTISGGIATTQGGNVAVADGGTAIVNGGTITGGYAALGGGNLFITGSLATVNGGNITNGVSLADGTDVENHLGGGNICAGYEAKLTLTGGTITGGTCAMGRSDIAVQTNSAATTLSGAPTVGKLVLVGKSLTIDEALTGGAVGVSLLSGTGEFATGTGAAASAERFVSADGYTVTVDGESLLLTGDAMAYMVGYGQGDITPSREDVDKGLQLQGFDADHYTNSDSKVSQLLATAMAVTDAQGDTVLLISVDSCNASASISNKARLNISRLTGIPVENISIATAHQHSTPYIATVKDENGNVITDYAATFHAGVKAAALAAMENRKAVTNMEVATVETKGKGAGGKSFNHVRNIVIKDGSTVIGARTDNHMDVKDETWKGILKDYSASYESNVDHTLQLVRFTLDNGKKVILSNFQTHPHLGAKNGDVDVHADIVGQFRSSLADANTDVIYFSGASGDVNPRDTYLDGASYEKYDVEAYGSALANLAAGAQYSAVTTEPAGWDVAAKSQTEAMDIRADLAGLSEEDAQALLARAAAIASGETAYVWETEVTAYSNKALRLYSTYHASKLLTREETLRVDGRTCWDVTISAFSLGPVAVVSAPYEMFQENGQQIKGISVSANGTVTKGQRADGFDMIIVATKANGSDGYIPSAAGYANGGYSTDVSWFEAGTGEALVARYQALLAELNPAQ